MALPTISYTYHPNLASHTLFLGWVDIDKVHLKEEGAAFFSCFRKIRAEGAGEEGAAKAPEANVSKRASKKRQAKGQYSSEHH